MPITTLLRLEGMTQAKWDSLTPYEKESARDNTDLLPQLIGLEGHRVEVTDMDGETRRFIVGKSTGWVPIHLEIKTRRSYGGFSADRRGYRSVRVIEFVR